MGDHVGVEGSVRDYGLSPAGQDELWRRWRIDYQLATPDLADRAKQAVVERAATYAQRWSDHAPVTVQYR